MLQPAPFVASGPPLCERRLHSLAASALRARPAPERHGALCTTRAVLGLRAGSAAVALLAAARARRPRARRSAAASRAEPQGADSEGPAWGAGVRRPTLLAALLLGAVRPSPAPASDEKQRNLPPEELAKIIEGDVAERAFMVSADLTRSVYDESCTFTDEIDTYEIDKFIKGTKALFLGPPYSKLRLTSPVTATATDVRFTFSEDLVFNIPLKPVVSLTGRMEMKRGPDGLITSYREYWDGGVPGVLSTVRLSGF